MQLVDTFYLFVLKCSRSKRALTTKQDYIKTKASMNEMRPPSKTRIPDKDLCPAPDAGSPVAAAAPDDSEVSLAVLLFTSSPDSDSPSMPLVVDSPKPRVDVLVPVASTRFEPVSRRVSPLMTVVKPGLIVWLPRTRREPAVTCAVYDLSPTVMSCSGLEGRGMGVGRLESLPDVLMSPAPLRGIVLV